MDFQKEILPRMDTLKGYCRRGMAIQPDFSSEPEIWKQSWVERSAWIEKATALDKELRPLISEWKKGRDAADAKTRRAIEQSTAELVSLFERLHADNNQLYQSMVRQREIVQNRLLDFGKQRKAIACYAGHQA